MDVTERRGCCVEATATETASNWSSAAAPADGMASSHSSSSVIITTLRLPDQGRARKKRDPIQFSFHNSGFFYSDTFESFC
jgi:hypothetical protein